MESVRALCFKHNALLIFDEIKTGVDRTGDLYGYQGGSVEPDILTTVKALGGDFPIAAMLNNQLLLNTSKLERMVQLMVEIH